MKTFNEFVRPAMLDLARGVEPRVYRREPCFRQHFVWCLSQRLPSRPGRGDWPLRLEVPTRRQYRWTGRDPIRGRFDHTLDDIAVELNFNNVGISKITRDLIKLLDDENDVGGSVYLAFGRSSILRKRIDEGFRSALLFLITKHMVLCLSRYVRILVIEDFRNQRGHGRMRFWEAEPNLLKGVIDWSEICLAQEQRDVR